MTQDPMVIVFAAIAASLIGGLISYTSIVNTKLAELSKQKSDDAERLICDMAILFSEVELIVRLIEKDVDVDGNVTDSMVLSLRKDNKDHYQQLLEKLASLRIRVRADPAGVNILDGLRRLESAFWGRCENLDEIHLIQGELSEKARQYCGDLISQSERTVKAYRRLSVAVVLGLMGMLLVTGFLIFTRFGGS